jgi:hypothetical protein
VNELILAPVQGEGAIRLSQDGIDFCGLAAGEVKDTADQVTEPFSMHLCQMPGEQTIMTSSWIDSTL